MNNRCLLASLALCIALAACQREETGPADPAVATDPAPADAPGDAAREAPSPAVPGLQVTTLDGARYDLADHRGRWVIVNFWATWCTPCLKEMPELSALGAMREHIEVIGLAYEEIEPEAMRAFLERHPVLYPIAILDIYDPPADFETPRGLPMTYLIAPDGSVARQFLGPITAEDIERAIAEAGGPPMPVAPAA